MGARPTEAVSALENTNTEGGGGVVGSVDEDERSPDVAEGEGEIVNLTALTDSMSDKAMCFAEQLEMEPEPTTEGGARNNESKQSTTEESSERQQPSQSSGETSNAQTNGHPTINNQPPPPKRAVPPPPPPPPPPAGTKSKQPLPPPPYSSPYTSSHPFQATASADVDLR
mmetsp:Transcript_23988/g.38944  ORF Transcript_23988/g.38944 Transcript_23988/m.38944 type:complete len:170 (-) Transcript_23988:184-693(-)